MSNSQLSEKKILSNYSFFHCSSYDIMTIRDMFH